MSEGDNRPEALAKLKEWKDSCHIAKLAGLSTTMHFSAEAAESVFALAIRGLEKPPEKTAKAPAVLWFVTGAWSATALHLVMKVLQ